MAFDTYRAVKDLEDAGFDEDAASAMVSVVSNAIIENLATKSDIAGMVTKTDIAELEGRMTVRFVWMALGIAVITTSLTSGIVGLLMQLQN